MNANVRPLHPLFAAEISGIHLASIGSQDATRINAFLDQYAVLVFRNQPIDDAQQIAFSASFGPLETAVGALRARHLRRVADERIAEVSNLDANGVIRTASDPWRLMQKANELWHTDSSFKPIPGKISILSAREVPTVGATTEFADLRAAYDALDRDTRTQIESLTAEHDMFHSRSLVGYTGFGERERTEFRPVSRPLVRLHPGSKRQTLYLASHASHILGLPEKEGRELLAQLIEHSTQPQFVHAHQWQQHDLVIWDNRCTMHRARPYDDVNMRRDMRRTTVSDMNP